MPLVSKMRERAPCVNYESGQAEKPLDCARGREDGTSRLCICVCVRVRNLGWEVNDSKLRVLSGGRRGKINSILLSGEFQVIRK